MIGSLLIVRRTTSRELKLCAKFLSVRADTFGRGDEFRRIHSSTSSSLQTLLRDLRQLDTSSLCDADKTKNGQSGSAIRLMDTTIRPMNHRRFDSACGGTTIMAGVARTVSFTKPNDFLPVMRALALEANADEVLVVDTLSSTRAVAGEIFVAEARRKGLSGIIIDGPIRDTAHLNQDNSNSDDKKSGERATPLTMRIYATSITPYSGTTQSPGRMQQVVNCGGVEVQPGDIVVGDDDGVLVGTFSTFSEIVPIAKKIQDIETKLMDGIHSSSSLASMTNLQEHVQNRLEGKASDLEFRL